VNNCKYCGKFTKRPKFCSEKCRQKNFRDSDKARISSLLRGARLRAEEKNLEFSITEKDIVIPERCPVLGHRLFFNGEARSKNSPSIDRIDNEKGYTPENITIMSYRANELKRNGSLKEFKKLVEWIEKNV
jgi:hypothetical protein